MYTESTRGIEVAVHDGEGPVRRLSDAKERGVRGIVIDYGRSSGGILWVEEYKIGAVKHRHQKEARWKRIDVFDPRTVGKLVQETGCQGLCSSSICYMYMHGNK